MVNVLATHKNFLQSPTKTYWDIYRLQICERFQTKTITMIVNAPRYITNKQIYQDLQVPSVQEEIKRFITSQN